MIPTSFFGRTFVILLCSGLKNKFSYYGVHQNKAGYEVMALFAEETISNVLRNQLIFIFLNGVFQLLFPKTVLDFLL